MSMFFQHFNPIQRWWPAPDTASDALEEEQPQGLIGWMQRFDREDKEAAPPPRFDRVDAAIRGRT